MSVRIEGIAHGKKVEPQAAHIVVARECILLSSVDGAVVVRLYIDQAERDDFGLRLLRKA